MHITTLLAQTEIVLPDLGNSAPWWGAIFAVSVFAIIRLLELSMKRRVEERAERYRAELEDRARDSNRQDNMLSMLQNTTALVSELIIKLNTSTEAALKTVDATAKEREALLKVVTINSGATHNAARQVEDNTQVLLSVSEIIQALKAQMERSTDTTDTARRTLEYLTKAVESLLRERMVQLSTSPEYNSAVEHLTKAVDALNSADLSTVSPNQGDSHG